MSKQLETNQNLFTVHHKNAKGRLVKTEPYRMCVKDKIRYIEKPAGSSQWFYENGDKVPAEACPKLPAIKKVYNERELMEQEIARLKLELASKTPAVADSKVATDGSNVAKKGL